MKKKERYSCGFILKQVKCTVEKIPLSMSAEEKLAIT